MKWRYDYASWTLKKLKKGAIFIFLDKDYQNFRETSHKKQQITQIKGEPNKLYAVHKHITQFSFMH